MEKQKLNVSTIVLIVAIVLIIGVIAGVFIGKNMSQVQIGKKSEEEKMQQENKTINNESKVTETNLQSNKNNASAKQEETSELNVESEQVKKLYSYIPAFNANKIEKNAYQSSKVTKDNISIEYLLAHAFNNTEIPDSAKEQTMDVDGVTPIPGWYKFDAKILQATVKEMYGENIENKSFGIGYGRSCGYENGKYAYGAGGGSSEGLTNIRTIIKAYEKDENIYVEDNYICLKRNLDKEELNVDLYSSTDSNTPLGVEYYKTTGMQRYKHTFKKNTEGNYYWYSTEPIK